jgi:XTP/dITP diphosphohydrolase
MRDLVIATKNAKKAEELRALLADMPFNVLSLNDFPDFPETPETGLTFEENARIKARAAALFTGKLVLADDSGLEVDALDGRPGIYSNRFAGPDASDRDKYMLLLEMMKDVPDEKRAARFRAAVCVATPEGSEIIVEGVVHGSIIHEPRGDKGFGYDPVFYLPEYGLTMAELPSDEKNKISHRAQALAGTKRVLNTYFLK